MKTILSNKVTHIYKLITALQSAGLNVITIRGRGQEIGSPLAQSVEVVLDDSADLAVAQSVIDSFDPVAEQAEVEAEEQAAKAQAEFLKTLTPKMFADLQAELTTAKATLTVTQSKVATLEADVSVLKAKVAVK